jgi:hypothetical protein
MKKSDAIAYFNGSPKKLASAVGLKSRQAIYKWPDEVPELYQLALHKISGGKLALSAHVRALLPARRTQ